MPRRSACAGRVRSLLRNTKDDFSGLAGSGGGKGGLEIFQGKHYGSIFGTIMLAALAGGAAGPWATGFLHDLSGSYTIAFAIGIGVSGLSAAAIWLASPGKIRAVAGQVHRIEARTIAR